MSNLIQKFEPESNLKVVEPEHEPKPCDIGVVHLCVDDHCFVYQVI